MTTRSKRRYASTATDTAMERQTDAARAMDSLRRVVHALRIAARASERAFGRSGAQIFVLRQLSVTSGQSLSDLAARTRTTQSSISEVVARLVRNGLVTRAPSSIDRRRAVLSLTAAGETILANAPETIQERLLRGFESLDEATRRTLAHTFESWLTASGLDDVAPALLFEPMTASGSDPGIRSSRLRRQTADNGRR
jgi:MarR family transcriptional regulator, lower aerobic nicotinate degradation pathway regulator